MAPYDCLKQGGWILLLGIDVVVTDDTVDIAEEVEAHAGDELKVVHVDVGADVVVGVDVDVAADVVADDVGGGDDGGVVDVVVDEVDQFVDVDDDKDNKDPNAEILLLMSK